MFNSRRIREWLLTLLDRDAFEAGLDREIGTIIWGVYERDEGLAERYLCGAEMDEFF